MSRPNYRSLIANRDGLALILVLWVLALLTAMVGQFVFGMRTELKMTRNFKEATQAYYIAQAGLSHALYEVLHQQQIESLLPHDEMRYSTWRINTTARPVKFGEGEYHARVDNLSGKIDINTADETLLYLILAPFEIDGQHKTTIVEAVLDWRDKDDFHRLNGAENDYYHALPEPYDCKNADFDTIEELLLVRGVSAQIFYGGLNHLTTVLPDEYRLRQGRSKRLRPSRRPRRSRININAAPDALLRALPGMSAKMAAAISAYRRTMDIDSIETLQKIIGPEAYRALIPFVTLHPSPFYSITVEGRLNHSQVRQTIKAMVEVAPDLPAGYRILNWSDGYG